MNYNVEIYCGGTYCGNAFCETFEECVEWAKADGFCDKAKITELATGEKKIIKL